MPPRRIIYWDSCIFIAWIKNETRPPGEMDGIIECVDNIEKGKILLITSVISKAEVFETALPDDVKEKYMQLLDRRNVQLLDNDIRISDLAREIREYYQTQNKIDGLPVLSTPDAIHLATAIHYKANSFYTFDKGQKGMKSRGLLSLNGNVAGYQLIVCKPEVTQYRMPL